ncbi:Chondroitin sulfate proteoglycan 4 [Amphibalanus amphitrite]|uniref:Chondroitin sulfate proteoglycan 4 n=1 Tax=Amphibalanus amphitrite TaxID=1232801 RepID=A0A6A4W7V4_AMPAM|nr:Chondroitin sulfate proteoglycan 4 [Amphibalanus amphitrite]
MELHSAGRTLQLDSRIAINDGVWHKTQLTISAEYVELTVDQTLTSVKPENQSDFKAFISNFFVGGLSEKNRLRASKQGITNLPLDFRGCVQNLLVNGELTGFPSVVESLGVRAECVWEYPCLRDPCKGGEVLLTSANIHVVLDYEKYGVRDSGVFFHVREPPKQGWPFRPSTIGPVSFYHLVRSVRMAAGTRRTLDSDILRAEDPDSRPRQLVYTLTSPTDVSGHVELDRHPGVPVQSFTQEQVDDGLVQFVHEGSDDTKLALRVSDGQAASDTAVLKVVVFRLEAVPANNTGLRLTHGASALITPANLSFTTNAQEEDMEINMVNCAQPATQEPLAHFTSQEMAEGRVLYAHDDSEHPSDTFSFVATSLNPDDDFHRTSTRTGSCFQHAGDDRARLVLWVSDGTHFTTGVLDVVASAPFVRLNTTETPLTVPRGDTKLITADALRPETNVEVTDENVRFAVTTPPQRGRLRVSGEPAEAFSFRDVQLGAVEYESSGGSGTQDSIHFAVQVGKLKSNGSLQFRIFPESYWEPLRVVNNRSALVAEGEMVTVSQSLLHVMHPNVAPGDIRFTVTRGPSHGFLMLRGPDARPKVITFDQAFINDGNLSYVQSVANATEDSFEFSVTNGIVSLPSLLFRLLVIPVQVRLVTRNMTLSEGGRVALSPHALTVASEYYRRRVAGFDVLSRPRHGRLELAGRQDVKLQHFTAQQLSDGHVTYVHSGDESRGDCLTLVALADTKTSAPGQLCFTISGVNDHPPSLVNNTGITVVQGGSVLLTTHQLDAVDADRPEEDLVFSLGRSECGNISLLTAPNVTVANFSRSQLDAGEVVFSHTRPDVSRCSVLVTVSDGVHRTPAERLTVLVERLQLRLVANTRLHVFPMMQQSITKGHLLVGTNDPRTPRTITYSVIRKPRLGKITREQPDGSTVEVSWFTQQDLNRSLVLYEHQRPLAGLSASDSVELRVETPPAEPLTSVVLEVAVSVTTMTRGGLRRYVDGVPLRLPEGGAAGVSRAVLDVSGVAEFLPQPLGRPGRRPRSRPPRSPREILQVTDPDNAPAEILYTIISGPSRGRVFLRGQPHVRVSNFSQADVDAERLLYAQDGSLGSDQFLFSVWDGVHSPLMTSFGITGERHLLCGGARRILTGNQTLSDAVRFELTASGVQPARGELQDSSSFIRSDYVLVAGVVIGVVVTSILLLIVVKCITDRRRRAERKARELGPAPLTELPPSESPRTVSRATTPDFINSTLPRPSISTLPQAADLAQPADVTYSYDVDADRQFCGDDWSQDGSDISASQPSNPILRKNQYWV